MKRVTVNKRMLYAKKTVCWHVLSGGAALILSATTLFAATPLATGELLAQCPQVAIADPQVRSAPTIFRNSDTIDVNQVAQLFGDSINSAGAQVTATGWSIPDAPVTQPATAPSALPTSGTCLTVVSSTATTAKILLPAASSHISNVGPVLGLFAVQLANKSGVSSIRFLNRAEPWWVLPTINDSTGTIFPAVQGGTGDKLIPGQVFRVFGRNLFASAQMQGWLSGGAGAVCPVNYQLGSSNDWSAAFELPLSCALEPGPYTLILHNGLGGQYGFGKTLAVSVGQIPAPWPTAIFNVKSFGAAGTGANDDTVAFSNALNAAAANGGGVVAIPPGNYLVTDQLVVPAFTQFQGTGSDQSKVVLLSRENGLKSAIAGDGNFIVQNLTLQTATAHRGIACPTANNIYDDWGIDEPYPQPCSNFLVDHVTINQTTPVTSFISGADDGLGPIITFGKDITIQKSNLSSLTTAVTNNWYAHHVVIANNTLNNGDPEYDGFIHANESVYEGNLHASAPGSLGGAVFVQGTLHYLYVANNQVQNSYGTWGEGFVAGDQPYEADWVGVPTSIYSGSDATKDPATFTVASAAWKPNELNGHVVYVVGGKGALQRNYVASNTNNTVTLANIWEVGIDSSSILDVVEDHSEAIFYQNSFRNVSVGVQLYAQSYGFVVDNNSMTDAGGSYCMGWNEVKPNDVFNAFAADLNVCFFNQWTRNTIVGSLNDPINPNADLFANTAVLGPVLDPVTSNNPSPIIGWIPSIAGNEVRNNKLSAVAAGVGAGVAIIGGVYDNGQASPACAPVKMPNGSATDTLVETNTITGASAPIQFWNLFGASVLWANTLNGGVAQDLGFDHCSPKVQVTTLSGSSAVSGTAAPLASVVQTQPSAVVKNVEYTVDGGGGIAGSLLPPFSAAFDSTTLSTGHHYAVAFATDSMGSTAQSFPIIFNVDNSAQTAKPKQTGTALVTAFQPGQVRNDYSGWVGCQIDVGQAPLSVSALGRVFLAGNAKPHTLKLIQTSTGLDVPGGTVQVSPTSAGTPGSFAYGGLSSPVTLAANTSYYLVSQETANQDQWYNIGTVSTTADAKLDGPIYWNGFQFILVGNEPNHSYVPLNLQYTVNSSVSKATSSVAMVTAYSPGTVKNGYTGWIGTDFNVGTKPIVVTSLGRMVVAPSTGVHVVKLVQASGGADVPGASVQVSLSAGTPGQYAYVDLPSPVTLSPNTEYQLVSQEGQGGDQWFDVGAVATTADVNILGAVYFDSRNFITLKNLPGQSYGPINLRYRLVSP